MASTTRLVRCLRRFAASSAAPLAVLFLALATVFVFGGGRGHFYEEYTHDHITWNHMTVATNLSPAHGFLGFYRLTLDDDGARIYRPYNRFPVLGHALMKLVTLPFPDDISARLAVVPTLMQTFFVAAATLAYLALCRLTANRWGALGATLLAFSSYFMLYYADMVATDGVVDLLGVMLVLHGMAVFATDGRFGQLLAKTCVALLLGWHVYALLLPFVSLGLVAALRRRDGAGVRRHLTLGVVALAFGTLVLATNFTREYLALGGEATLAELPSVQSMLRRTGVAPIEQDFTNWAAVAERQWQRISLASTPHAVSYFIPRLPTVIFVAALVLLLWPAGRHRLPLAALALSGSCWAFGMRYQSHIAFESMFNVGFPLALFALLLSRLDRWLGGGKRVSMLAGVAALAVFALSSFLLARSTAPDPEHVAYDRAVAADVNAIRGLLGGTAEGKTVALSEAIVCNPNFQRRDGRGWRERWKFYFTGSVLVGSANRHLAHLADFVVDERVAGARTLTPGNRLVFLYDRPSHDAALRWYEQHVKHDAPALNAPDYDIHVVERNTGNELLYLRENCPITPDPERLYTFLHIWPADVHDLPPARRRLGFDALVDFDRVLAGWRKGDRCYAVCPLPDYAIAKIHTGLATRCWTGDGYRHDLVWEGSFSPALAAGNASPPSSMP